MEQELLKLGVASLICLTLLYQLRQSEKREEKKDMRKAFQRVAYISRERGRSD